ncbi:MAG: site-specific DNA-methyltransferase, partial [Planctomycetia bacterium]|nr:site-specific DNA-methyltransferase [Planctomycetia bacterium]
RIFQKRGKPLNGWSEADRAIPKQYYEWCMRWAGEWNRVLKPGASAIVFAGRRLAHRCICAMEDSGFILRDLLAWDKVRSPYRAQRVRIIFERRGDNTAAQMWDGWRVGNLRPRFEPILWFVKPYPIGGTIATNLLENGVGAYHEKAMLQWGCPQDNILAIPSLPTDGGLHPTQKPLKLMQILIDLTTKPGQWVCDPFCGSGTTLVAAQKMGRKFTGFEIDESFYLTAQKRLEKECEQMKLVCMD